MAASAGDETGTAGADVLGRIAAALERMAPPDGAFYLYVETGSLHPDSVELCREVLAATGVAMTPGVDFDAAHGGTHIRLSLAAGAAAVSIALDRIAEFTARLG